MNALGRVIHLEDVSRCLKRRAADRRDINYLFYRFGGRFQEQASSSRYGHNRRTVCDSLPRHSLTQMRRSRLQDARRQLIPAGSQGLPRTESRGRRSGVLMSQHHAAIDKRMSTYDPVGHPMEEVSKSSARILTLTDCYVPGYKSGGPLRSIENLVAALGGEFDFRIVTLDRDLGDKLPFPGVVRNRWVRVGHADVMYLRPD